MEVRRRLRKNKIINDIRDANTFINRSDETIKRLRRSQMGEEYVKAQITKLKDAVEEKKKIVEQLNKDVHDVTLGQLDDEIDKEHKNNKKRLQNIRKEKAKASAIKKEVNDENKEVSQNYWKGILDESRTYRQKERDIKYGYKYYNKIVDLLPAYMKKNLAYMPNNKGYIWRDLHFYGDLPEQSGPRVMFEKQRGGLLIIHEYTDHEYRRYEKEGKNRKQLVHKSPKRLIKSGSSLMDYLKK